MYSYVYVSYLTYIKKVENKPTIDVYHTLFSELYNFCSTPLYSKLFIKPVIKSETFKHNN